MHAMCTNVVVFLLIWAVSVAGCVSAPAKNNAFQRAKEVPGPVPGAVPVLLPELVEEKQTVSLKGQLKPVETFKPIGKRAAASPARAIDQANKTAAHQPSGGKFINAITVYDYMPGILYQLYCSPAHITDIMLQPGEELTTDPGAGDTVRWMVGSTQSGQGQSKRTHVLIKPVEPGLHTNIVITTTRHVYHLEAQSYKTTYMAAVSWNYPHEDFKIMSRRIAEHNEKAKSVIGGVDMARLNFGYRLKGRAKWRPVRVFDDGQKTYIEFPGEVARGAMAFAFSLSRIHPLESAA
jgi:P-type conjugative transfer protein TrbG